MKEDNANLTINQAAAPYPKATITRNENHNDAFIRPNKVKPQTLKNTTPCPFLLRRGCRAKGEQCDLSHIDSTNASNRRQTFDAAEHMLPCLFLRRKGSCLKGHRCDFLHDLSYGSALNYPEKDSTKHFLHHKNFSHFLPGPKGVMTMMSRMESRIRKNEGLQHCQLTPPSRRPRFHTYPRTYHPFPRPLREIPFQHPNVHHF